MPGARDTGDHLSLKRWTSEDFTPLQWPCNSAGWLEPRDPSLPHVHRQPVPLQLFIALFYFLVKYGSSTYPLKGLRLEKMLLCLRHAFWAPLLALSLSGGTASKAGGWLASSLGSTIAHLSDDNQVTPEHRAPGSARQHQPCSL